MAVQSEIFSTEYGVRSFISTKHIATKQHMSVWLQRRSDNIWVQLSISNYELINNSAVLTQAPNSITYSKVEIRVADTPDELGSSQSEIAVLAGLYDEIVALNGIKNDITTVAGISGDVTTLSSNILDINSVVTNIVPNLAEILQADTNATIATTKASEASASATSASNSSTSASNSATSATNQATIATTKASEAATYASNALTSENNAIAAAQAAGVSADEVGTWTIASPFSVATIGDLSTIDTNKYTTAIVKDLDRGGTFIWSATGTSNGGTVFAGVSGYWNRQYSGAVSVKWFGAKGDGVTDDTTAIQSALDSISAGDVFCPRANYLVSTIRLKSNTQKSLIGETLTTFIANTAGTKVISIDTDVTRSIQKYVKNIRVDGNNLDVTGIGLGGTTGAVLYCNIQDCLIYNCTTGIDLISAMECSLTSVTVKGCEVGLKVRSVTSLGGGNANTFIDTHYQQNEVGVMVNNVESYPLHNNIWTGGTIQGNSLCGLAVFGKTTVNTYCISFYGIHFEANGLGVNNSKVIDTLTIFKSAVQLDKAEALLKNLDLSESVSPAIKLLNKSIITLDSANGYGSTSGVFIDGTMKETAVLDGATSYNGTCNINTIIGSAFLNKNGARFSFLSKRLGTREFGAKNSINKSTTNPLLVSLSNRVGIVSTQREYDTRFGICESTTFTTSVGSTSSNRGTLDIFPSAIWDTDGAFIAVSFLVKSDAPSTFQFNITSGSYNQVSVNVIDEWQRVVMLSRSSTTPPLLYIYPLDTAGATLKITNLQSAISQNPEDMLDTIHGICNTIYKPSLASNVAPTIGYWMVGDIIYNTNPASSGNIGWVCTASGTPGTWKTFGAITA